MKLSKFQLKMQKFKEKKTFFSFFQKSFQNSHQISQKTKHRNAFSQQKGNIEESIFFNYPFDKGRLKTIICWFFEKHGQYKTLKLLEKLKEVGFGSATNAGISLGIDDLKIPNQKIALVSTAETKVAKDLFYYRNAKITGIERVQRLIYTWNQTNDTLKQEVVRLFETTDLLNPIYMMAFSGARGNMSQVRQLVGMRGLMSDPQGQIIDFPIQSNFREGLTLTEYLISTYGARKGIVDTALRTATAGYLTRRLVDVAQHTIVSKFDCGTMRGIFLFDMKDGKKTIYSFQNRLIGRVLAQNIEFSDFQGSDVGEVEGHALISLTEKTNGKGMLKKKQIAFRNQEIDSKLAQAISKVTKKAFVRSPLTCETSRFVCQLCYGWSFSHGKLVSVGEAVGIIAAQSIGEPGTQLTMRTFHTGGVFAGGLTDQILAPFDGKIQYFQSIPGSCIRNALSEIAFFTKMPGSFLVEKVSKSFDSVDWARSAEKNENFSVFEKQGFENAKKRKKRAEILRIPAYAVLFCRNNEFVRKKQVLAQFSTVLKKMQYGRAEQTLYSTLAGEFVFGSAQHRTRLDLHPFLRLDKVPADGCRKVPADASFFPQNGLFNESRIAKNYHTIGDQSLLVEKRRGDFSEVELKNDILWKSQNWTTVWILSGNIFSDSFNKNFHFRKGDFFKKTSVLQRILWTKKKRYKYSLFGKNQMHKKTENTFSYLFAFEKKKFHNSFLSAFWKAERTKGKSPFFQNQQEEYKKSFQIFSEKNKILLQDSSFSEKNFLSSKHIQTNFSLSNFSFFEKENFLKSKKIYPFCVSLFSQKEKNSIYSQNVLNTQVSTPNYKMSSNISLNVGKNIDFHFVQNKSNRFLTDFQKMNLALPTLSQKYKTLKTDGNITNHLFFKFLNKRKKNGYPLFLNGSVFSKSFQISQKFGFFSFSNFSNPSFFKFFSHLQDHNLKKEISLNVQKMKIKNQILPKNKNFFYRLGLSAPWRSRRVLTDQSLFLGSPKNKKESKEKFLKNSFFSNTLSPKNKKIYKDSNFIEKETKNILLKKYLLRFPVDKIYYKKFGYVSSFSNFEKNKKVKNSFQSFSTLTKNENFENPQRNRGQREKIFPPHIGISSTVGNENFFGKDTPHYLSSCFFENFCTTMGGIFQFSFFEHDSKKQKVYYFLCENFSDQDEKKILFLKPEFLEKNADSQKKKSSFLQHGEQSFNGPKNFFLYSDTLFHFSNFRNRKENSKKSKKILSSHLPGHSPDPHPPGQSPGGGADQNEHFFIFQIPTFSFLSLSTNSFLKPFYSKVSFPKKEKKETLLEKQQKIFQFFQKLRNQKNENEEYSFSKNSSSTLPKSSLSQEKTNFSFHISFPEFGNGNKSSANADQIFFPIGMEKMSQKKLFEDTSKSFKKEKFSPVVLPVMPSFFEKRKQIQISANNPKIKFFDFSNNLFLLSTNEKKNVNSTKKVFFFYNFCFEKFHEFSPSFNSFENKKHKNFSIDLYEKEIFWLPQESFLVFTSEIGASLKNSSTFPFYSRSDHKPFLFFVNSQGKKKSMKEKKLEGFVKISNFKIFGTSNLPVQKKKKERKILSQKLSFYPVFKKNRKNMEILQNNRKKIYKKNILSIFQKRMKKNHDFEKIQKLFSSDSASFNAEKILNKSFLLDQKTGKNSKNESFFAKKLKNQCFTCLPFLRSPYQNFSSFKNDMNPSTFHEQKRRDKLEKNQKSKIFFQNKKLQFKVQQGWLLLPFSSASCQDISASSHLPGQSPHPRSGGGQIQVEKNSLFKDHKKIQKKGHFFEKNINFEQNDIVLETVLLENSSSLSSFVSKKFIFPENEFGEVQTKKISFHADFIQTNKKCRYISFNQSVQVEMKEKFRTSFFSQKKERKQKSVMQFIRPFHYKVLENSQNSKKLFQNIRLQVFSKVFSSSCFQLYKGYHSYLLNTQKPEKCFLEKNPNNDFQVWSNFSQMYFSQSVSPFISFAQNTEKLNYKKQFLKKFNSLESIHEKSKNPLDFSNFFKKAIPSPFHFTELSHLSNGEVNNFGKFFQNETFQQILEKNGTKNFFFDFGKNKENKNNFSFYPIQFLPLLLSFFSNESKNGSLSSAPAKRMAGQSRLRPSALQKSGGIRWDFVQAEDKLPAEAQGTNSSFPTFSLNVFQNTIEFQLCEKRAAFFEKRFSFGNISDFIETSSFWLNKDSMNFLFSPSSKLTKSKKLSFHFKNTLPGQKSPGTGEAKQKQKMNFHHGLEQNFLFQKNLHFYGSTEFLSPYEGELLPIFTHDLSWWKKASEVSTLQKFEKLFTIVSKKDFFSVQFPLEKELPKRKIKFSLKEKQKHLGKLYEVLSDLYQKKNLIGNYENLKTELTENLNKKTKISSFITKYEKKIYTFQNLTVGYPSLFKKPFLASFVAYGDNFFGSALQKPGQIIHLGFSSMTVRHGQPCFVSANGILHFSNIPYIKKNVPLVTLPYQTVQAGDIVQGIPKVEQFFEARTTLQGRLFVSSLPILLKGIFERYKVLLPLEQATRQSFLKIQQIIVDGVQRVYRSQGVSITDKHLEVVVRQMTTKVQILHGAQTGFFPGELVNLDLVERINKFLMVKIRYEPVILGITRASLEVDSFLSASSFQQTTKILSLAAISRKKDFLKGLKENLLVGNLIPSGTGYFNLSKKI